MAEVTIDGIRYTPAGSPSFGVAITTYGRPAELDATLNSVLDHVPTGTPVIVVDDAGTPAATVPDQVQLIRHTENLGIPAAKNTCLDALAEAGCDHFFLLDDDVRVLDSGIWDAYISSPEEHLSYQFPGPDMEKIWDDGDHVAYTGQRGVLLYYDRHAIETVGGFDEAAYGRGYYDHVDLAYRIRRAGLTRFQFMDVAGSSNLLKSLDETHEVTSSTVGFRDEAARRNANVFNTRRDRLEDVPPAPWRPNRPVVLTSLLTTTPDPQRGTRMAASYASVKTLTESIRKVTPDATMVLFHDATVTGLPNTVTAVTVTSTENPYFARWVHALTWLRAHPEADQVLICDATDVELLGDVFAHLPDDHIVVGEEFQVTGCQWMRDNHTWGPLATLWDDHADDQLLNAGVLAGPRHLVLAFLNELVTQWELYRFDLVMGRRGAGDMVGDMALFNLVARNRQDITHGPRWTTRFKGNEPTSFSLIRHK